MKVKLNGNDFFQVSSSFGVTDNVHTIPHTGIDLVMETGTQLFSPVDGVVTKVVDYGSDNIGKGLFIETDDHQTVIMGHLSDIKAKVGDNITQGDFVALSGNTGHSTGSHLHLGLKDTNGSLINPEPLMKDDGVLSWSKLMENGKVNNYQNDVIKDQGFLEFLNEWRKEGFWEAMYDKSFFEVFIDFFKELFHDLAIFILGNGDLFFLCPAILLMFGTFIVGKNKYSKFIIPLWFTYFVSSVFHKLLL